MSEAPPSPVSRRGWLTPRRLAVVLGVWAVAVGAALLLADALDSPVGEGARDEAQAVAPGPVASPGRRRRPRGTCRRSRWCSTGRCPTASPTSADPAGSPPERARPGRPGPAPPGRAGLGPPAARRRRGAAGAYRAALPGRPDDVAAGVGLAMVEGAGGGAGLARAAAGLAASPGSTRTTSSWPSTRAGSRLPPPRGRRREGVAAHGRPAARTPASGGRRPRCWPSSRPEAAVDAGKTTRTSSPPHAGLNRRLSRACDHAAAFPGKATSRRPEIPRDRSARCVSS